MMNEYDRACERAQDARADFGLMMKNWRIVNGWTQYTACTWAKEAGFEAISYGNLSVIEQGKAGELRQKVFIQLQELNRRIAEQDYGSIKTLKIRDLVKNAKPVGDENVSVWTALEFLACYMGLRPVPEKLKGKVAPHFNKRKAIEISNAVRKGFKNIVAEDPGRTHYYVEELAKIVEPDQINLFLSVLFGCDYTVDQLRDLYVERKCQNLDSSYFKPLLWIDKLYLKIPAKIDFIEQDFTIPARVNSNLCHH